MRALAQFIMRGRWQAATVALLGSWFPLVTPATIGLVSLRRGAFEGALVLLWALLPAAVGVWASSVGALMAYATMGVMVVVLLSALMLRTTTSWSRTLGLLVASSALAALLASWAVNDVAASLANAVGELAMPETPENGASGTVAQQEPASGQWSTRAASGVVAYLISLTSFLALLLGRWWQALLYNPGGLQAEMHGLRLSPGVALASAGAVAWCVVGGSGYEFWANVFGLPLMVAGVGLVHYLVKHYRLGLIALVVFYAALVFVRLVVLLVAIMAFADVWLNIRNRLKPTQ